MNSIRSGLIILISCFTCNAFATPTASVKLCDLSRTQGCIESIEKDDDYWKNRGLPNATEITLYPAKNMKGVYPKKRGALEMTILAFRDQGWDRKRILRQLEKLSTTLLPCKVYLRDIALVMSDSTVSYEMAKNFSSISIEDAETDLAQKFKNTYMPNIFLVQTLAQNQGAMQFSFSKVACEKDVQWQRNNNPGATFGRDVCEKTRVDNPFYDTVWYSSKNPVNNSAGLDYLSQYLIYMLTIDYPVILSTKELTQNECHNLTMGKYIL